MTEITQHDLLDALRAALALPDAEDGATGPELVAALGCARERMKAVLRKMLASGQAEVVTVKRPAIDGRTMTIRGYRLKQKAGRAA